MYFNNYDLLQIFDKELHYFDFVVHLNKKVLPTPSQQKKFAYRMSKGNACAAYFHAKTKDGLHRPHMHVLLGLKGDDVNPYIENLFDLFDANNKHKRFESLKEENIRVRLHDWNGMFLYISNEWTMRETEWRFSRFECNPSIG